MKQHAMSSFLHEQKLLQTINVLQTRFYEITYAIKMHNTISAQFYVFQSYTKWK